MTKERLILTGARSPGAVKTGMILNEKALTFHRRLNIFSRGKKTKGGAQKPFLNGIVLSLLFVGQFVFAQSALEQGILGMEEDAHHCAPNISKDALYGSWTFSKIATTITRDLDIRPFPKRITIDEGALIVELRSQSQTKVYPLLSPRWDGKTIITSMQTYNDPDRKNQTYTLEETAELSFQEGILTVDLKWISNFPEEGREKTITGSYQFCRAGSYLMFSRTNNNPSAEEPEVFPKAFYQNDNHPGMNLNLRTLYKERKGGE